MCKQINPTWALINICCHVTQNTKWEKDLRLRLTLTLYMWNAGIKELIEEIVNGQFIKSIALWKSVNISEIKCKQMNEQIYLLNN